MTAENAIRDTYDRFFGGEQNMGSVERALSTGLGLIMAAGGVRRADWQGAVMGLAGAALVARGMSGHCPVKAMMEDGGHHRLTDHGAGGSGIGGDGGSHVEYDEDSRLRSYSS